MRVSQGITQLYIELVVVDVMQKHIHPRQVIGRVVDLLPIKTVFNEVSIKVLFSLQEQRTRTTGWVINFIDTSLLVHCKLGNQPRNVLRRKKLTARFTRIRRIVRDQKLIGITK